MNKPKKMKWVDTSPNQQFVKFKMELGHGAVKDVYKGWDLWNDKGVAWCETRMKTAADTIRHEAALLRSLHHQNILCCFDNWESDRTHRQVMITELCKCNLRDYVKKDLKHNVDETLLKKWCRQILLAIKVLHSRNPPIIHRDIKPENIFVEQETENVKLGDFGLACELESETGISGSLWGVGSETMAPEVFDSFYDEKIDIYSFGMTVLQLVTKNNLYRECHGGFGQENRVYERIQSRIMPAALYEVNNIELRDFIEFCVRAKEIRPSAVEVLEHPFLAASDEEVQQNQDAQQNQQLQHPVVPDISPSDQEGLPSTSSTPDDVEEAHVTANRTGLANPDTAHSQGELANQSS